MSVSFSISLPEAMKEWVDEHVAQGGYGTPSEFFHRLIRQEQQRELREQIDANLLAALESGEATPMTAQDWEDLRAEARAILEAQQKSS